MHQIHTADAARCSFVFSSWRGCIVRSSSPPGARSGSECVSHHLTNASAKLYTAFETSNAFEYADHNLAMSSLRGAALPAASVVAHVRELRALPPEAIGGDSWWTQRRALERLNAAAHAEGDAAAAVGAAFALVPSSLDVLVCTLLAAEAWRDRVAPQLCALLHDSCDALLSLLTDVRARCCATAPTGDAPKLCLYLALYHEAVVANLLEAALLTDAVADAASEDALFELADYGVRSARPWST